MFDIDRTKDRVKTTGEVFSPPELVNEILDKLPQEVWSDPSKTWLDPTCGDGNFLVEVKRRLMESLKDFEPDEQKREHHVLNNQIYGVDLMIDNVKLCRYRLGLNPDDNSGNIVCADGLQYDYEFIKALDDDKWTSNGYKLNYNPNKENIIENNLIQSDDEIVVEDKKQKTKDNFIVATSLFDFD